LVCLVVVVGGGGVRFLTSRFAGSTIRRTKLEFNGIVMGSGGSWTHTLTYGGARQQKSAFVACHSVRDHIATCFASD